MAGNENERNADLHDKIIDIAVGCNFVTEFVAGYDTAKEWSEARELPGDELLWLVRRFLREINDAVSQLRALRDTKQTHAAQLARLLTDLEDVRSGIEFMGAFAAIKREGMAGDAVVPAIADVLWLAAKIDRHAIDALATIDELAHTVTIDAQEDEPASGANMQTQLAA